MTAPTPERRVGEAELLTMTAEREAEIRDIAEHFVTPQLNDVLGELDATRAANARLTAEVERLTKEKEAARSAWEWYRYAPTQFDEKDAAKALDAALSLPTPAPEATE